MLKKRPAITLFITLAVIVAMLSLVGIVFSYLNSAKNQAQNKSALIESNLIYADAIDTLKNFLGKKPSNGTLKNIYDVPLSVNAQKVPFSMLVACTPSHAAIPITWFSQKGENSIDRRKYGLANLIFENLTTQARLKDPALLESLISKYIDSEEKIDFGVESRLKHNKKYLSYKSFKSILAEYRLESDDDKVYDINWQNYYSFGEDYNEIDGNFLSAELISILFGIDKQIVAEDFKSGYLKKFLEANGGDMELYNSGVFAKKPVVAMKCNISYTFNNGNYSFNFKYNNGKVDSFEFNK